jgi:hypothetical protein
VASSFNRAKGGAAFNPGGACGRSDGKEAALSEFADDIGAESRESDEDRACGHQGSSWSAGFRNRARRRVVPIVY